MDWTHRLRLRQLQVLLNLIQTQNISHSAEQLHISQPALSKWLKQLEDDIGLPLFERHVRGLRPTIYGEILNTFATQICGVLDRTRDEMAALRSGSAGRVIIGATGATIASVVPQAVRIVLDMMPNASIEIREAPMDALFQQLTQHEIDIALGRASAKYHDAEIASEQLYEERLRFAVRAQHPLTKRRNLSISELFSHRWVVWTRDIPARDVLENALSVIGLSVPNDVVQSNSLLATIGLVADSDMIAVVAERAVELPGKTRVLNALPITLQTKSALTMYWRKQLAPSSAIQILLDAVRTVARTSD